MIIKEKHIEILEDSIEIINKLRYDLAENGIELIQMEPRETGNNIQIQCPYHGNGVERKPSAGIRKTDGIFHCFACNETHSFIELVSDCFGRIDDGAYGLRWLTHNFTVQRVNDNLFDLSNLHKSTKYSDMCIIAKAHGEDADIPQFVSEEDLDKYRWTHPYWSKRGIVDEHIIELFDLGYDIENHCITFPIRDIDGNCLFVAKRSVRSKFFKYPQGVYKPVYGIYELYQTGLIGEDTASTQIDELFICESMIDAILLWQSGYYAVAMNGLGTDYQFKQISNLPILNVILCTDNDDAGKKARKRLRDNLTSKVFSEIKFPKDIKDIGECSREQIDNIMKWRKYDWET